MANLFGYLLLVIFCAIIASSNGEDQFKARKLPGGKGWTLNSAAYNGGKEAIRHLYGKRSDHELGDFDIAPAAEDAKRTQFIQDFLQFLKLQESGIFDQKMLRYILSLSNDQITQP
ncbi:galanin peptides-like isoform X2 [Clavelina lepadiformis]